jgi:hypothetical protein
VLFLGNSGKHAVLVVNRVRRGSGNIVTACVACYLIKFPAKITVLPHIGLGRTVPYRALAWTWPAVIHKIFFKIKYPASLIGKENMGVTDITTA